MATTPTPEPAGFFALRTPLLPFDELIAWSDGLEAAGVEVAGAGDHGPLVAALARDRDRVRARLRGALRRPEVREALFLASPALTSVLEAWMEDPESPRGRRAEPAVVRYFERSAGRATPFGLCAGCSLGTIGERTRLELVERDRYRRRSRLDMDYLCALAAELTAAPGLREHLRYRPNPSLYRAGGRLRYVETRLHDRVRSHHLVSLQPSAELAAVLARAGEGATAAALAASLAADGISPAEAERFVGELIEGQVLVADLELPVTGEQPLDALIAWLAQIPAAASFAAPLVEARARIAALDAGGLGVAPDSYRQLAERLAVLPTTVDPARLVQVDLVKPAVATLGPEVVAEIVRAVELAPRIGPHPDSLLSRFRERFVERYERREVPLVEALDEESGIGFAGGLPAVTAPLLRDLELRPEEEVFRVPWGAREALLLRKLSEALAAGAAEIELSEAELAQVRGENPPPLPDAFVVEAVVAAASPPAIAAGRFRVLLRGGHGPSGARLLGRFCHADEELHREVASHLRAEEAAEPDAIFAEVVCLPQGRIGNILLRPLLRDYEIPYLGRSGAAPERQIPVTDLWVSVAGDDIVLRSRRLGRRVVPRLTTAHAFSYSGLPPLYRFLAELQGAGRATSIGWSWGPLADAPFLPRVRSGRLVLSLARWRLDRSERERLQAGDAAARFAAVQAWRLARRLPRCLVLAEGDQTLPIDLDNVLSVEAFLDVRPQSGGALLVEQFPAPDELCAAGPEGRFVHELVVPFVAARPAQPRASAPRAASVVAAPPAFRRSLPLGSDWLFVKVYGGTTTLDDVLREAIAPLVAEARAAGVERWFFMRYADPQYHLRLRFQGDPELLRDVVQPLLHRALAPCIEEGRVWRVQLDTYEREVERYGGPAGMELAERIFHTDSEAVLEIVGLLSPGDAGEEERWRLAAASVDRLLADFGLDLAAKREMAARLREAYGRPRQVDAPLRRRLAAKYRQLGRELDALLDATEGPLSAGLEVLAERSARVAPCVAEMASLVRSGRLSATPEAWLASIVHLHANRFFAEALNAQELVLYDLLERVCASRLARGRGNRRQPVTAATVDVA